MKKLTIEEAINREFPLDKSYAEREAMFVGIEWQKEKSYDLMQQYAEFCIECNRIKLPVLSARSWYKHLNNIK